MKLPAFEYACPSTLAEAVALLAAGDGDAKVLAGGQSLVPMMAFRVASPALLVDLRKLSELRRIEITEDGVRLGAMVRWRDIEDDARLDYRASAAQGRVARRRPLPDPQPRHRRRQHRPCRSGCGDAGHRGDLRRRDRGGRPRRSTRPSRAADFFIAPLTTALAADEIIVEIRLPAWPAARRWAFEEFARRRGDFAMAGTALFYDVDAAARRTTPMSARSASATGRSGCGGGSRDQRPRGRHRDAASAPVPPRPPRSTPQSDIHASAAYRKALLGTLVERALQSACAG